MDLAGAGKTMISVLLVKHKADELSSGETKKVTIFLAPKVDLVLQVQNSPATLRFNRTA